MTTNHDDRPAESPQAVAAAALSRDKRRRNTLAVCTGLSWLLLAASVFGVALFFVTYIAPVQINVAQEAAQGEPVDPLQMQRLAQVMLISARVNFYTAVAVAVLLILSATATLLYVRASQQAGLRQVHAQLADISDQLRLLQQIPRE